MKLSVRALALCLGLSTLLSLASCTDPEVTDGTTTTAPETTTAAPSPVVQPDRYDYFGADVSADIDFTNADYTAMQLTLPADYRITDEDVQAYIDNLRYKNRTVEGNGDKVTDKTIKFGDSAYIYYKGVMDGEEFEGGSNWTSGSPYCLGIGSGSFIPGFEEGLIGVSPAEATREDPYVLHVTFPEDYSASLAGKEAIFFVAVMYTVPYTVPTYDRAFAEGVGGYTGQKSFYASDKAFLLEYEESVKAQLESEIASSLTSAKTSAIWKHLIEKATFISLPEEEVSYYKLDYESQVREAYTYYCSADASFQTQYPTIDVFAVAYLGIEEGTDWLAYLTDYAKDMVKRDMLVHAIAEREGMEIISEEEYQAELDVWEDYYQDYGITAEQIEAQFGQSVIRESALSAKVLEWLDARTTYEFEE